MSKLHELLAVEEDRRGKANKIALETQKVFKSHPNYFIEQIVTFKPHSEEEDELVEGHIAMTTTVKDRLDYTSKAISNYFDVFVQKENANTEAKADVVLFDGTTFMKDVPATALLALEKELGKLMTMYDAIPTLEATVKWADADDRGEGFKTTTTVRRRTKKITKPVVMYPHSEQHPAQVKEVSEDIETGLIEQLTTSSKLTSLEKSNIIGRLDNLKIAIKKARMRANTVKVPSINVGKKIFSYIHNGTIQ